jgi:hypothetical protein
MYIARLRAPHRLAMRAARRQRVMATKHIDTALHKDIL